MSVIQTLRLFHPAPYLALIPLLEGLAMGRADTGGLAAAIRGAIARTEEPAFREFNKDLASIASWPQELRECLGVVETCGVKGLGAGRAGSLSEILVASLCMPGFQSYSTVLTAPVSETTFIIGQWDEGLLVFLRQNSQWFDKLFAWDSSLDNAPFPYGQSMAILTKEQLEGCRQALALTAPLAASHEELAPQHARLTHLVDLAASDPERTLVLTTQ